jgi:hypothetical protein
MGSTDMSASKKTRHEGEGSMPPEASARRRRSIPRRPRPRARAVVFAAFVAVIASLVPAGAHEIPADVLVQMMVKPEGNRLRVLLRVPLVSMRDINFPQRNLPGDLDFPRTRPLLRDAATLWLANSLAIYEGETRLASPTLIGSQISLPSDRSFMDFASALGHVTGPPLPDETTLPWTQALFDVAYDYQIASPESEFSIHSELARLGIRTVTVLRFYTTTGEVRPFEYSGDPGLIRLDPRWHHSALRFVHLGFDHILDGIDHLLFLLCLVIPFRRFGQLVLIVTSFTVAHSITLIASAFEAGPTGLWFPPLIETLIAMSIVYMALENIVFSAPGAPPPGARAPALADSLSSREPQALSALAPGASPLADSPSSREPQALSARRASRLDVAIAATRERPLNVHRRWLITFAFGLVHGFGFSFALRETLQFAGPHLLTSLVAFNIGVELGQLLALAVMMPGLYLLFRYVVNERLGAIILSALIAHTAWHWMVERGSALGAYEWPALDAAFLAAALRWTMLVVGVAAIVWLVRGMLEKKKGSGYSFEGSSEEETRGR